MKKLSGLLAVALCLCLLFPVLTGCDPKKVTVEFDTNGGNAIASQTVRRGKRAEAPANPARSGYIFDGWQTEDGTEWAFDQKIKENVKLIAKWRESGVSLSVRNLNDVFEDVLKPYEEKILAFFNYEFITTQFSTFVNTDDPEAVEVYKRLDGLQIKEDPKEFKTQLDDVLGTPSAVDARCNVNVNSRFRYDYKIAKNKIQADLASSDPAVVAAAERLQDEMLGQLRVLKPAQELPLPSDAVVAKWLNDVYKDFGNFASAFEPMDRHNVPLQINAGEATAEETLRDGTARVSFEYEGRLRPSVPYNPKESSEANVQTAAAPGNWYTFASGNAGGGSGETEYAALTSFSGYVIRKTLTISTPGTYEASYVSVSVSVKGRGASVLIVSDAGRLIYPVLPHDGLEATIFVDESSQPIRLPAGETLTVDLYVFADASVSDQSAVSLEHFSVDICFGAAGGIYSES